MSQGRRQAADDDRLPPATKPPISPASRNEALSHSSLASNLIPRDYLGPRSAVGPSGKPTPSPLHTNLSQMSSSSSPANPSPFHSGPPITQIAHAAFPAPPSNSANNSSGVSETMEKKQLRSANPQDEDMAESQNHTPRKTPDATKVNPPASSSPESFTGSVHTLPDSRSMQRVMPRTSSIDSAISSLSSSQSQKSFDANALSPADIGNLISAAGSAEAVIVHLLKEKHHAASQNSQLWRLVDKQRSLIFGLNKDLERSVKEKEKYKNKIKDLQNAVPPLPTADDQPPAGARNERSDAEDSLMGNSGPRGMDSRDIQSMGGSRRFSMFNPISYESPASANNSPVSAGGHEGGIPQPSRKPPPAPLNLRQAEYASTERPKLYDSDSEYEEDILDVDDEISTERGRRKTREEDDREREAALDKDQDAGSVFERKGDNISNSSERSRSQHAVGMSGARQMTAQYPPAIEQPDPAAPFSNAAMTRSTSQNDRYLMSAPKSPGLPISPRPEDRPYGSALPRMPREPPNSLASLSIPQGNNNISGLALSPRLPKGQNPSHSTATANDALYTPMSNRTIPLRDNANTDSYGSSPTPTRGIYRGFVSEDYPNFLLPPNALPLIQIKVSSSRLRPSRNSYTAPRPFEEEPVFTLSVFSRSAKSELWRVEKVIAALPQLDQQIRHLSSFAGALPDRNLFNGHSPAKVDARRAALNSYFEALLETPMDERAASIVCHFLSSDAIEPRDDETSLLRGDSPEKPEVLRGPDGKPWREGYLTKRGKNFGGWKARYFVLHGPELKYFETPGGPHMGTIKLQHAQIGKQSEKMNSQTHSPSRAEDDIENQYRHAFLILEPKKKDSSALVRHVLCAESDEERDAWVEVCLAYVEGNLRNGSSSNSLKGESQAEKQAANSSKQKELSGGTKRNGRGTESAGDIPDTVQGFSYDDAIAAEPPVLGPSYESAKPAPLDTARANQALSSVVEQGPGTPHPVISGPTNGAVIQNAGAWGNKAATSTKEKKRSIWGFRTRSSADLASQVQGNYDSPTGQASNNILAERRDIVTPVFGMPLAEAVQLCPPQGVDVYLPAVVYRCIEYLEAKEAASEEGIFRLSGSNVVVKGLKERFNTEGDVDLLNSEQNYDVHAVASLFKQYLRELPTTVLTRELHLEFLRVLGKYIGGLQW